GRCTGGGGREAFNGGGRCAINGGGRGALTAPGGRGRGPTADRARSLGSTATTRISGAYVRSFLDLRSFSRHNSRQHLNQAALTRVVVVRARNRRRRDRKIAPNPSLNAAVPPREEPPTASLNAAVPPRDSPRVGNTNRGHKLHVMDDVYEL